MGSTRNRLKSYGTTFCGSCLCIMACGGHASRSTGAEHAPGTDPPQGGSAGSGGTTEVTAARGGQVAQAGAVGSGGSDGVGSCGSPNSACEPGCYRPCLYDWDCPVHCVPIPTAGCGNGLMELPELCDDGNTVSGDGCSGDCLEQEPSMVCPVPGKPCRPMCPSAAGQSDAGTSEGANCGNGRLDCGEDCDDGTNDGRYGGCTSDCHYAPYCGDGIAQFEFGETCDIYVNDGRYGGCTTDCRFISHCGDAMVEWDHGETCDDGFNDSRHSACGPGCQLAPSCGDGIVQTEYGETCDNQINDGSVGGCTSDCRRMPYL